MNKRKRFWLILELAVILIAGTLCLLKNGNAAETPNANAAVCAVLWDKADSK